MGETLNRAVFAAVDMVRREPGIALAAAAGAYLLLLLLVLALLVRSVKQARKMARILSGADGHSIERMLLDHADTRQAMETQLAQARQSGAANAESLRQCLQRVGLVRYDAFPDVGGEQSFSVALLDAGDNGLVLTGLFSRNDMRVYAKPVSAGASPLSLTEEEKRALASAAPPGDNTAAARPAAARPAAAKR